MGALSGLATGIQYKPSDVAVDNIGQVTEAKLPDGTTTNNIPGTQGVNAQGQTGTYVVNPSTGAIEFKVSPGAFGYNAETGAVEWQAAQPGFLEQALAGGPLQGTGTGTQTGTTAQTGTGLSMGKIGTGLALAGALSGLAEAPPQVVEAVSTLSPEQQEYFNRPTIAWDWNALQADANANNLSLSQYMARNWNVIAGGRYNMQPADPNNMNSGIPAMMRGGRYAGGGYHMMPDGTMMPNSAHKMNMGGGLSQVARYYEGGNGSGRIDNINAHLSPNEYVMDAETVALLGDGSPDEGAKQLDMMREKLRMHKGKELSKGKFSPDAKSPLNYLKGVA